MISRRDFVALGTLVTVTVYDADPARFESAAAALERHLLAAGTAWYPRAEGELAALNAALAAGRDATASPALLGLLQSARDYERRSGGRFNACLHGYRRSGVSTTCPTRRQPDRAAIAAAAATSPSCSQLELDPRAGTVRSRNPQLGVDVGGIAKGTLLVDARRILAEHGIAQRHREPGRRPAGHRPGGRPRRMDRHPFAGRQLTDGGARRAARRVGVHIGQLRALFDASAASAMHISSTRPPGSRSNTPCRFRWCTPTRCWRTRRRRR